jgi:hypothetical protein
LTTDLGGFAAAPAVATKVARTAADFLEVVQVLVVLRDADEATINVPELSAMLFEAAPLFLSVCVTNELEYDPHVSGLAMSGPIETATR